MGANRGTEYRSLDGKMMDTEPAAFAIVLKGLLDFLIFSGGTSKSWDIDGHISNEISYHDDEKQPRN